MSTTTGRQPGAGGRRALARGLRRPLAWLVVAILVGGGLGIIARAFEIHPVRITSGSMSPTVKYGDWIVVRDVDHGGRRAIDRGDIVLFRYPLGTTGRAIKRVVALGGDRVAINARTVTVNGRVIPIAGAPGAAAAQTRVETIPPGQVFLLGDNAEASIDSRSFGPVPETEIVGRKPLVIGNPDRTWLIAAIAATVCGLLLVVARRRRGQAGP